MFARVVACLLLWVAVTRAQQYEYPMYELSWGGPERGCQSAQAVGGWEVKCALPAGRLTLTVDANYQKLTLQCEDGAFRCSELSQAREHLPPSPARVGGTLRSLSLRECALGEPLACVLAVVNASDVTAVALSDARGQLTPADVRGLRALSRLRISVADKNVWWVPFAALSVLPALSSFALLGAALQLSGRSPAPLPQLTRLELAAGDLQQLPPGAFADTPHLETLLLWGNNMQHIHEDALQGLSALRNLSLNSNRLTELPPGLLRGCPRLRLLHVYENALGALPRGLLAHLTELQQVKIFNNNASLRLENRTFADLPSLRSLQLDSSGIQYLPEDLFANTPLQELSLSGNKLTSLPSKIFVDTTLTKLTLSQNNISQLPSDLFSGQSKLEVLDLARNSIKTIPNGLFVPLEKLTRLDLKKNELERLDSMTFVGLSSLTELDLSANRLAELRADTFEPLQNLQVLSATHNGLRLVSSRLYGYSHGDLPGALPEEFSAFRNLKGLTHLLLSHNRLRAIAPDWRLMTRLLKLDLAYNEIRELTDVDMSFLSAATVDLRHNNISRLAPPPADSAAAALLLADNPYRCDCRLYPLLRHLRALPAPALRLAGAACAAPRELAGRALAAVEPAALTCAAPACPAACACRERPATGLLEMTCPAAPRAFPPAPAIQLRLLNATDLPALPSEVKLLNLSGLNLTEAPRVGAPLELDLRFNRLTRPPLELLRAGGAAWLAHNPLACDCGARPQLLELAARRPQLRDWPQLACADGALLAALRPERLCAARDAALVSGALAAAGLLLALLLLLAARWYAPELRVLLRKYGPAGAEEGEEEYDAFVSFAHQDAEWVFGTLLPRLERGRRALRLCVHSRDWVVGDWIPEQIARSVERSRRTVVVLSEHFLRSPWAQLEFRAAHSRARALLLVLDERALAAARRSDPALRAYVSTNTYLRADDPLLWERLRAAVRRPRPRLGAAVERLAAGGLRLRPADLQHAPADPHKRADDLQKHPEDLQKRSDDLKKQLEDLKNQPDDLQKRSDDLKKQLEDLKNQPDDLKNRPDDLPKFPADLNKWPDDLQKQLEDLRNQPDDLKKRPASVHPQLDGPGLGKEEPPAGLV